MNYSRHFTQASADSDFDKYALYRAMVLVSDNSNTWLRLMSEVQTENGYLNLENAGKQSVIWAEQMASKTNDPGEKRFDLDDITQPMDLDDYIDVMTDGEGYWSEDDDEHTDDLQHMKFRFMRIK
jgi:hypothetical protein